MIIYSFEMQAVNLYLLLCVFTTFTSSFFSKFISPLNWRWQYIELIQGCLRYFPWWADIAFQSSSRWIKICVKWREKYMNINWRHQNNNDSFFLLHNISWSLTYEIIFGKMFWTNMSILWKRFTKLQYTFPFPQISQLPVNVM